MFFKCWHTLLLGNNLEDLCIEVIECIISLRLVNYSCHYDQEEGAQDLAGVTHHGKKENHLASET